MDDGASRGVDLGRRVFVVGAAVAAAAATLAPIAAAAEAPEAGSTEQLAVLASACVQRGEECASHCLAMFSAGDTTLASCARSVHEMIPVCEACEKECRKHAKDHVVCAKCGDACKDLAAALRKRTA